MKTFLILVMILLVFLLFASSSLATVDLTPNTPASVQDGSIPEPQVINIQEGSQANTGREGALVPVTGACTNPYTVREGDYLSGIAEICSTSMAALRTANPEIANANLIYPGQQLWIPVAGVLTPAPLPVTGGGDPAFQGGKDTGSAPPNPSLPKVGLSVPLIPQTGSGASLQVKAFHFPANTPVNIAIGTQKSGYTVVASGITGADGSLITTIAAPSAADRTTRWTIVVTTGTQPVVQAFSQPFTLRPD